MSVKNHTSFFKTLNCLVGLRLVVILLHEYEHVVKPALNPQIEMPHSQATKSMKLIIRPSQNTGHGCIHIDFFTFWKILLNHLKNLQKPLVFLGKCIPVSQKNPLRTSSYPLDTRQFLLNLGKRQLSVF